MKFAAFRSGDQNRIGLVSGDGLIDVSLHAPGVPHDMRTLIAEFDTHRDTLKSLSDRPADLPVTSVELLAPVERPGKIFAIGLNYADHIEESGMETPEEQVWFTKAVTSVNAPYAPVEVPKVSPYVDYEAELVAVIGRGGRHIKADDAAAHIFGYCVGNDVTERLWQHRTPQWSLGKSFDTHAPIGPWITTSDEVSDPHNLDIRCMVNGEVRQHSNTRHLHFDIWQQIEQLSAAMTLEPGDLVFTGTPGGIGATMDPRQFLQPGDTVRCEIDELGAIEAVMAAEA